MLRLLFLSLVLALAACASVQYDLPAVSDDTDGQRRAGKFIWRDLISDDPQGSAAFYGALFGWEFRSLALLGANYWVISLDGELVGGMVDQSSIPAQRDVSQWVSVMSVTDTAAAARTVKAAGGQVLREPVSIGERGVITVLADPQGAVFAALDSAAGDPRDADALPPEGAFLWHELWTSNVDSAARLYATLGQLDADTRSVSADGDAALSYVLLRDGARARAGMRPLPAPDMPSMWLPYLRVASLARLSTILEQVPAAGGTVLVPATQRPAGGFVAVIAGPSGAPVALQTWADDQPLLRDL